MKLTYATENPNPSDLYKLYLSTGWNDEYHLDEEHYTKTVESSWHAVSCLDGKKLVGFGRIVSDGILHALIVDMMVLPEYQGCRVGTEILRRLVEQCRDSGIPDIQLFCAKGKRAFYEKNGFYARPENAPGMEYRKDVREKTVEVGT